MHALIYRRYSEVWVPDYADSTHNLAGDLAHGGAFDQYARYIGPLSRFSQYIDEEGTKVCQANDHTYPVVAILSGLEPQRTYFEQALIADLKDAADRTLIVRGKIGVPATVTHIGNITLVPHMSDEQLMRFMHDAQKIMVRSGYSTIMDLAILGLLDKAYFYPTPGQSEQEYLALRLV